MRLVTPRMVAQREQVPLSQALRLFYKHANKAFRKPQVYVVLLLSPVIGYGVARLGAMVWPSAPGLLLSVVAGGLFGVIFGMTLFASVEEYVVDDIRSGADRRPS